MEISVSALKDPGFLGYTDLCTSLLNTMRLCKNYTNVRELVCSLSRPHIISSYTLYFHSHDTNCTLSSCSFFWPNAGYGWAACTMHSSRAPKNLMSTPKCAKDTRSHPVKKFPRKTRQQHVNSIKQWTTRPSYNDCHRQQAIRKTIARRWFIAS